VNLSLTFEEVTKMSGYVPSFDGLELFFTRDVVDSGRAVVLIVHGMAEHSGRYDYVKDKLNAAGYSVYRYDNRGHGNSKGTRGHLENFNHFIDDANFMVDMVIGENRGLPVFMLGHSMGGFIAAAFGAKYPGKLKGIVLSAAATNSANLKQILPPVVPDPMIPIPNSLSSLICTDPAVVTAYEEDPLVLKETTLGLLDQFCKGQSWLNENEAHFHYPCLILHGGGDQIVPAADSKRFYENILSQDKSLKIYDDLYHEILNEPVKDAIIADIIAWINGRL